MLLLNPYKTIHRHLKLDCLRGGVQVLARAKKHGGELQH